MGDNKWCSYRSPNSLMTAALHARYTSSMKSKRIEFSKTSNFTKKESSISLKQLKKCMICVAGLTITRDLI